MNLMEDLDRRAVAGSDEGRGPMARRMRRLTVRSRRRLRKRARTVRGRLPKGFPGARRYIDL